MRKRFSVVFTALILTLALVALPTGTAFANIADGTYQINYEMKESGSDNTSIADGYFMKPATLTVKDGVKHIQLTVTSSSMIKSLSAPSGPVNVVSEDEANETRTVKFQVGDLSQPVKMDMHIIVPDIPEMPGGYDMEHAARAVFDVSGLTAAGEEGATTSGDSGEEVVNPPTGDSTPIALYVTLLLSSIAIFTVYKVRVAKN